MLREKAYVFGRLNAAVDLFLSIAAFYLAYWLRQDVLAPYVFPNFFRPTVLSDHLWLLALMPPLTVLALAFNGYYASQRVRTARQVLAMVLLSVAEAGIASLAVLYFYKGGTISRGQLLVMPAVQVLLISIKTLFTRQVLVYLRAKGYNSRNVLLVGSGEPLAGFVQMLETHPFWGFSIKGIISDAPAATPGEPEAIHGHPVVGHLDDTLRYLWEHPVDEVVFLPMHARQSDLAPVLAGCEEMGVRTHLALNSFSHQIARPELSKFEDIPVVTYSPVRPINTALVCKYVFDRVGALFLLLALSPLFALISLAIRATSRKGEPVFYGQIRCGLNGKTFTCWKFRSMRIGADAELGRLARYNEMQGPVFKMRVDPRVTPLGRFLRRTSLDEIPQLYNVLRGEMSLVGPRPPIPAEVLRYDRWQRRRLSMKPGMTCLWQVGGRSEIPFEKWMKLDLEYIDNWSLFLDMKILLKTVFAVITGRGAM